MYASMDETTRHGTVSRTWPGVTRGQDEADVQNTQETLAGWVDDGCEIVWVVIEHATMSGVVGCCMFTAGERHSSRVHIG